MMIGTRRGAVSAARICCGRGVAVQAWHGHVHEDEVRLDGCRHLDPGLAVGGDVDLEPLLLQREDQDALDIEIVVDDQDLGGSQCRSPGEMDEAIIGFGSIRSMVRWAR